MALVVADRIKETTTTTGTGTYTLAGAVLGFEAFSSIGDGNTTYYCCTDGTDFEVGIGTYTSSGTTLARTTVLQSSNSDSAVNWTAGERTIFVTQPAEKAVYLDASGYISAFDGRNLTNVDAETLDSINSTSFLRNDNGDIAVGSNKITGLATPTANTDAATKAYVDSLVSTAIHIHDPVRVERPDGDGNLAGTYNNGTAGVGATLTNNSTQVALSIDGVTLSTNDRVLLYNQTDATENGVYTVTNTGSASTNWVLTRATDADSSGIGTSDALDEGSYFYVDEGNTGAGESYVCNVSGTITFGTTEITFAKFGESVSYTGGTGIDINVRDIVLDLSELTTSTSDGDGDFFAVVDSANAQKKLTKANINLSGFNNDSGFLTEVSNLTLSNFAGSTIQLSSESFSDVDTALMTAAAIDDRILSFGYTTNVGDITGVTAGTGLSGGGSSGTVSLSLDGTGTIGAGTYGSTSDLTKIDTITVDAFGRVTAVATGNTGDGGNAATLDSLDSTQFLRSDAADTKTSGDLTFSDNVKAVFGTGSDLEIYHDGTRSYIQDAGDGDLRIIGGGQVQIRNVNDTESMANFFSNGKVQLNHDGSTKLETTSTGATITGYPLITAGALGTTAGDTLELLDIQATQSNTSKLRIFTERDASGSDWTTAYTRIQQLIDVTEMSYIQFNGDGNTYGMEFGTIGDELYQKNVRNAQVELYFNGVKKFETTNTGVSITGTATATTFSGSGASLTNVDAETLDGVDSTSFLRSDAADTKTSGNLVFNDNVYAQFGTSGDLNIFHNGSNSFIRDVGTGDLFLDSNGTGITLRKDASENMAKFITDGAVELYYDNSKKLETTTSGATVTGDLTVNDTATSTWTKPAQFLVGNLGSNQNAQFTFGKDLSANDLVEFSFHHVSSGSSSNYQTMGFFGGSNRLALRTDGSVSINTPTSSPVFDGALRVAGDTNIAGDISLTSTDDGATENPTLDLYRNSASPANGDVMGHIQFSGNNDSGSKVVYAEIESLILNNDAGSENARLRIKIKDDGSDNTVMEFGYDRVQFSESIFINNGRQLVFEGATVDDFETTLTATEPTQDNTITLPDASGTVLLKDANDDVIIEGTDAGSGADPTLVLYRNSASPATFDSLGKIEFKGNNSDGTETTYFYAQAQASDETAGTEDGVLRFYHIIGGNPDRLVAEMGYSAFNAYGQLKINASATYADPALVFEGSTTNSFETFVKATDPTADRTITLPDATGTVLLKDANDDVTIESTDDSDTENPNLILFRNSSSPATNDNIGTVQFQAKNSADETFTFAEMQSQIGDVTDGSEDGNLFLQVRNSGSLLTFLGLSGVARRVNIGSDIDLFLQQDSNIRFEGATSNDFETTLTVADPTADRTITLPDASGTVALSEKAYRSINAQTGETYTTVLADAGKLVTLSNSSAIILADAGKLVTLSNSSAITLTIPPNSSVAYSVGTKLDFIQIGAGQVTVAGGSGVTVNSTPTLKLRAQHSGASCIKIATDTWQLVGDLAES